MSRRVISLCDWRGSPNSFTMRSEKWRARLTVPSDEISRTVIAEASGFFPGRAVVCARDMRNVVLEVMLLKTELRRINVKRGGNQRAHVAHCFLVLAKADEIQNLGGIRKRVLDLSGEVGIAVLTDGDVINIRHLCARGVEAGFNGERRKAGIVLDPIQALFGNGKNYF